MSHLRAICAGSAIIGAMLRVASVSILLFAAACTKSPPAGESASKPLNERPTKIDLGAEPAGGGGPMTVGGKAPAKVDDSRFRLLPEEGKLSIEVPATAQVGSETVAKVIVTPGAEFKVNVEFPTKLTIETPTGVTVAKAELKAGGADKAKGDADVFDEKQLAFTVKLTPGQSGSHTINGSFKFAVCDKAGSTCLAKKEPIAIQLAAK